MIIDAPQNTDIPALCALWKDAFGDTDDFLKDFFSTAFSPKRALCAREDGKVVGMLYWFDCIYEKKRIAYLYAIATHKDFRKRGICNALMETVHLLLQKSGYMGAILVPAKEHLFSFYRRMGYTVCAHNSMLRTTAADAPIELRPLSSAGYAALRPHFLPTQSVLQEGENLLFLETLADFWAGDGILLAVRKDTESLFGLELLGDLSLAPRIARTFGFKTAEFRTVGQDTPFAMFRSLEAPPLLLPAYFAFAFD